MLLLHCVKNIVSAARQPTKGDNRKIDGRPSISNAGRSEYIQITSNVLNGEL
jgi:hypothetical protein